MFLPRCSILLGNIEGQAFPWGPSFLPPWPWLSRHYSFQIGFPCAHWIFDWNSSISSDGCCLCRKKCTLHKLAVLILCFMGTPLEDEWICCRLSRKGGVKKESNVDSRVALNAVRSWVNLCQCSRSRFLRGFRVSCAVWAERQHVPFGPREVTENAWWHASASAYMSLP